MWSPNYPRSLQSSHFLLRVRGSINIINLKSILKQNIHYFNNPKINDSSNFIKYTRSVFPFPLHSILRNSNRKLQLPGTAKFGKLFFERSMIKPHIIYNNKPKHNGTKKEKNTEYIDHIWWLSNKTQNDTAWSSWSLYIHFY